MLILGIETSCDETSVSIVEEGKKVLANTVTSSVKQHSKYGGIVPEIAARFHVEYIACVLSETLNRAKASLKDIRAIAVTSGPGLIGSLLIGVSFAKALGMSLNKPLIGVNHLRAHLYSPFLDKSSNMPFPFVGLVVSGGHTILTKVENFKMYKLLGKTLDDACGEAFDKVARILNLSYPGGPIIDKLSKTGDPNKIKFPRAIFKDSLNFSFSGLKTAVLYYVRDNLKKIKSKAQSSKLKAQIADIAASFQEAILDCLVENSIKCCIKEKIFNLVVGGGVIANSRLKYKLVEKTEENNIKLFLPDVEYCMDNAAMVAGLAFNVYNNSVGKKNIFSLIPDSNLGIS